MSETPLVRLGDILDVTALEGAIGDGLVSARPHPNQRLYILNYTPAAQYSRQWSHEVKLCRGLIIEGVPNDPDSRVVARPFAKFANLGEFGTDSAFGELPEASSLEVTEKLDGSLGVVYFDGDEWAVATRGAFTSPQAVAATRLWRQRYQDVRIPPNVTLLCEYVAPWNRVVVAYPDEQLIAIAAIDIATGADTDMDWWSGPRARVYRELRDLDVLRERVVNEDTGNAEGFVVRFTGEPGVASVRAKVKYAEYLRLHRLATGISTQSIWEHLSGGLSLDELLEIVPDEFYRFVSETVDELTRAKESLVQSAQELARRVSGLERKDAARVVTRESRDVAAVCFVILDGKDPNDLAWKFTKPEFKIPQYREPNESEN